MGKIKQQLQPDVTLALTATATPLVQKDIIQQLQLHDPLQQVTTVDRPNIYLATVQVQDEAAKQQQILAMVQHCQNPGIIYFQVGKRLKKWRIGYNNMPICEQLIIMVI